MEEGRSTFNILAGKPTRKRPLRRSGRKWEDNIRMDPKEIGINTMVWTDSNQDRDNIGNPCECCIEPPSSISRGISQQIEDGAQTALANAYS